jgi:hypothetical protein
MLMSIEIVLLDLKCRMAPGMLVKMSRANKKSAQKNHRAIESRGTHTTLRRCASGLPENPQKTAIIGRMPNYTGAHKAHSAVRHAYAQGILPAYINDLENMRSFLAIARREG